MHVFELQELEEATEGFSAARLIGKGSHGSVYRGTLRDGKHVAVKKQSLGLQKLQDNTKPENEALILSSIHPNPCIIEFLGVSHDISNNNNNKIIVTEYMPRGTLHQLLHFSTAPLPLHKRVEIALQVAKGLLCLHESDPPIVHRDIKSANLLFDDCWNVKLADFGLATRLHTEAEKRLPAAGTIGYIDPSYTTSSKLSTKNDVFSYGVVLLELVSGRKAIDVSKSPASIVDWALPLIEAGRVMEVCDPRARLSLTAGHALRQLLGVAARCLSTKRSRRPAMNDVVSSLVLGPIHQLPWSLNCVREMVVWMMRPKKSKYSGECCRVVIKTSGTCDEDKGISDSDNNNISKGRLLVREILADIPRRSR